MEIQRWFDHGYAGERMGEARILFAGYFSDEQGKNKDIPAERTTTTTTSNNDTATMARYRIENFYAKVRLIFKLLPASVGVRTRWQGIGEQSGGRAHFNQALIELKTRILLREPQTEVSWHYGRGNAYTDATLQVCLAPGLCLSKIGAI